MSTPASRAMKPLVMKWLLMLVGVDSLIILLLVLPDLISNFSLSGLAAARVLLVPVAPVVILILTGLLPSSWKAVLVFWRFKHALPGHFAFSKYAQSDPRIHLSSLRKNVGKLPDDPVEQNGRWYQLYRAVSGDVAVLEANRLFTIYREMAAISVALLVLVPPGLLWAGSGRVDAGICVALFFSQYLATAVAARHQGVRLVCTVLAVHSSERVCPASRAT